MPLNELSFLELIREDLEQVESLLRERPPGQHGAIGTAVNHLVGSGGKRIRPALVLLSGRLCGADVERAAFAAAAVEMLHTATLVHDDLIDGSLMRRGVKTLNTDWSPAATVLTGDYIFARAAYLVSEADSVRLTQRFAETLMVICNGEIRQMFDGRGSQATRKEYWRRIHAKTASLIGLSAEAGAILARASEGEDQALRTYGEKVGTAFQIVDDVLDFTADEEKLGKPMGGDLSQGLITLPVLLFLEEGPERPAVRRALQGDSSHRVLEQAVNAVAGSSAVDRALAIADEHADEAKEALNGLPDSPYRTALSDLADFVVTRRF